MIGYFEVTRSLFSIVLSSFKINKTFGIVLLTLGILIVAVFAVIAIVIDILMIPIVTFLIIATIYKRYADIKNIEKKYDNNMVTSKQEAMNDMEKVFIYSKHNKNPEYNKKLIDSIIKTGLVTQKDFNSKSTKIFLADK